MTKSKKAPAAKKTQLSRLKETLVKSLNNYRESRANSEISLYKLAGAIEVMQIVINKIEEIQNDK
tara:strand:+ start:243 stop:437 length:195 start_codon:yes stop_codon:yes gene_type:complete